MKKKINRGASQIALAIIIAGLAVALPLPRLNVRSSASAENAKKSSNAPSALQGEDAIRSLKERGLYDSLQEAVAATRYELRREDAPARGDLPSACHAPNPRQQYDAYLTPMPIGLSFQAFTQQANLTANDGARNDNFGLSVAVDGDRVVVGAPGNDIQTNSVTKADQGSVYVFLRVNGSWSWQATLTASDGEAGDYFGYSVAIQWDTIVVGAPYDDTGANTNQGSAYVFVRNGANWTNWIEQQKLLASTPGAHDYFGYSVAIDAHTGGTIAVGAPYDDVSFTNEGSAYVFVRNSGNWVEEDRLVANTPGANDYFGHSVACERFTAGAVVVGAPYDDVSYTDQGSAYVFVRNNGNWNQQAQLLANDAEANDYFGYSVAISSTGNRIAVGAPYDDIVSANDNQGSAYVFLRNAPFWNQHAKLTSNVGATGDLFGWSVAVSGYEVVVGAPFDDIGANPNQGSAYVFVCNGPCGAPAQMTANGASFDYFGYSVAIKSGTTSTFVAGALYDDIGLISNQGSAYVFIR